MGDAKASDTEGQKTNELPEGLVEATEENGTRDGQRFINPATVGSGTITADGKIGPPTADPNALRGPYVSAGPRTERWRGGEPPAEESGPTDQERSADTEGKAPTKTTAASKTARSTDK